MQERPHLEPSRINRDLLQFAEQRPSGRFWVVVIALGALVAAGLGAIGLSAVLGLGLMGYAHNQFWTTQIVTFAYWAGVSHAGIMVTAILRLSQAEWRRPITRSAEMLTVFALVAAAIFPITHTGRPWRTLYWIFPYDFTRDIWPSIRSALVWDATAILTYLISSFLFVYVSLLPDLAVLRDRANGWRRSWYTVFALGFRGSSRQWRVQKLAAILLPTLILAIFVSDHSAVAWDFSMALVPGWHSTVFGPYFVAGSIYSGVAAVVAVMALLRWSFNLPEYLTTDHFDAMGRLLVPVSLLWLFLLGMDFYFGLFSLDPVELAVWELRLFTWPWGPLYIASLATAFLLPFPVWAIPRLRRNVGLLFLAAILTNVGLYLERYILVIAPLSAKQAFVFTWITSYEPTLIEYVLVLSTVGIVALGIVLFAKLFPIIPLYDVKEEQLLKRDIQVGRAKVPGVIRATAAEEMMA